MVTKNKLASMVGKIGRLPGSLQPWALSWMFNSQVSEERVDVTVRCNASLYLCLGSLQFCGVTLLRCVWFTQH